MRLISATVRNYRVHRDLTVDFDRTLTLVGGANECGKSTLAEALHRALFMRARGNAEHHRLMASEGSGEAPEVRLQFEAGGRVWQLVKSFGAGSRGRVSLSTAGAPPLVSEEAERRLAGLLGNPTDQSGRAMLEQWRHLWVWQGSAGEHPGPAAGTQNDALMRRLQAMGGAVLLQSELDQRTAGHFAERVEAMFNQNGRPKAGSDLERAERESRERAATAHAAAERWAERESLASELSGLRERMRDWETERGSNLVQLEAAESGLRKVEAMEAQLAGLDAEIATVTTESTLWEGTFQRMIELRSRIGITDGKLSPLRQNLDAVKSEKARLESEVIAAEREWEDARTSAREADLLSQWWKVLLDEFQSGVDLERCRKDLSSLQQRRQDLESATVFLAAKPALDRKSLNRLRGLESDLRAARAAVEAMAAEVEVLSLDQKVTIDGADAAPGSRTVLTQDGVILVGGGTRIRIRPGGGDALGEARDELERARDRLRGELDSFGLADFVSAESRHEEWSQASARVTAARQALDALDPEAVQKSFEQRQRRHQEILEEKSRLSGLVRDLGVALDVDGAELENRAKTAQLAKVADEKAAEDKRLRCVQSRETLRQIGDGLAAAQAESGELENQLLVDRAQLQVLMDSNGRPEDLLQRIESAKVRIGGLQASRREVHGRMVELQPACLRDQWDRLVARQERLATQLKDAREEVIRTEVKLEGGGQEDLRAVSEMALQQARLAEARWEGMRIQGDALRLLDQLFESEQAALARQFTKPFEECLSGYLERIFGPGTEGHVTLGVEGLTGVSLGRTGAGVSTFGFDSLSGGTREQVAVAVRLAMAEVLAGEHEGCLPIVLDDAFAYSDPERVQRIQDMLFLAGRRGLQVILLTCTPRDYAGAGGKEIHLRRPSPAGFPTGIRTPLAGDSARLSGGSVPDGEEPATETADLDDPVDAVSEEGALDSLGGPVTEDLCEAFIAALPADGTSVANSRLRQALGWEESRYDAVRNHLVDRRRIQKGRGRGGTVNLVL